MNIFYRDSQIFMTEVARNISEKMSKTKILLNTMNLALGLERILKGILFDINPTFVLVKPDFNNSVQVCYKNNILSECKSDSLLNSKVDEDVITFRNSLLRASICSKVTSDNKNLLFFISESRDIIAHHDLQKLEYERLELLLKSDFYLLISTYCEELNISKKKLVENKDIKLATLSAKYQTDIGKSIKLKIESALEKWKMLKNTDGFIDDKNKVTNEILNTSYKFPIVCPACNQRAILYTKPEFSIDPYTKQEIIVGAIIKQMKCQYCKLTLKDFKEFDFLKLADEIPKVISKDIDET